MTTAISRQDDAGSCARPLLSFGSVSNLWCLDAPAVLPPPPPAGVPRGNRDTKGWRLSLYLVLIVVVVVLVLESKSL